MQIDKCPRTVTHQQPPQSGGANTTPLDCPLGHRALASCNARLMTVNTARCDNGSNNCCEQGVHSSSQYPINRPNGPGIAYNHPMLVTQSMHTTHHQCPKRCTAADSEDGTQQHDSKDCVQQHNSAVMGQGHNRELRHPMVW